jgi:hypothetical protein
MDIPDDVLRVALEEYIAFGPRTRRPAEERVGERLPNVATATRAAALAEARRAVALAEALAREYVDGKRTQGEVVAELRRAVPWAAELAPSLGHFGYHLVIM